MKQKSRERLTINSFTIRFKLPSLNEVIAKNRANKYYANKFKEDIEEAIGWEIKQAISSGRLRPISKPCVVNIDWYEATRRRDVDNIQSSAKFIMDSLVENGVLKNDSQRYVNQIYHEVHKSNNDYVVVTIDTGDKNT